MPDSYISRQTKKDLLAKAEEYLPAEIHMFAAGRVGQKSMESSDVRKKLGLRKWERAEECAKENKQGGATTSGLLKAFYQYESQPSATYRQVLEDVRSRMKKAGYEHVTQLSSSRPIEDNERFHILPKGKWGGKFTGRKRALIIGINYKGSAIELPGCQNDAWNMCRYLREVHGFKDDDMTIMMDDGKFRLPTATNIKKAMYDFCFSLQPGDAAFFHFSGHGAQLGNSQVLFPVDEGFIDKSKNEFVEDKEIFRLMLLSLPKGVKLTAVVDCCHSGKMFDLPFQCLDEGHHNDIYEPRFRHAKYVPMERMRVESMMAIKMPLADMEEMILPPPKTWRERTLGEGWDDFWRKPKETRQIKNISDDRSVSSMGALDKRKKRSKSLFSKQQDSGAMSGLTGFSTTKKTNISSDDRSVSSTGALDKKKRAARRKKEVSGDLDGSSAHTRRKISLSEWKSAFSRKDAVSDDRSVSSMGALDKRKKRSKSLLTKRQDLGAMSGLTGISTTRKTNIASDDRSVSSTGALDKKKKAARRKRELLRDSAEDTYQNKRKISLPRRMDSTDDDDARSICSTGALDKKRKARLRREAASDSAGIPTRKKSSIKKSDDNDDRSVSSMGTLSKKKHRNMSTGGRTGLSDAAPPVKQRPALKRVGSAHQLGRPTTARRGKKSQSLVLSNHAGNKSSGSSVASCKRVSVPRRKGLSNDDDDRSVCSTGALEKKRARLKKEAVGDLAEILSKNKSSTKKNGDTDDRSVSSVVSKKKHMPRNKSMGGLSGLSGAAGPVKHRPGLKRVDSAHQLGRPTMPRRGRKNQEFELGNRTGHKSSASSVVSYTQGGTPQKHMPFNKQWNNTKNNALLGQSEHGTKSTGFELPKKHKPGTMGQYLPGSYARPPPIRSKSDLQPVKHKPLAGLTGGPIKKLQSLSVSNHDNASFYSSENTSDTTSFSIQDDSGENKNTKWKKDVLYTKSTSSCMSEMTDDDGSITDDDDDEFLTESTNIDSKHTSHSIQDIRNARRRRSNMGNRKMAKGRLESVLLGTDDVDPDFSNLGGPGLGIGEKPRKTPPKRYPSNMSRNTVH